MTTLKVRRTSKDQIKPFCPTPNHLKTYQFSFLDQVVPHVHMPLIFFYQKAQSTISLKSSLSETLVQFYPLAGTIEGNTSINCNDDGVEYYEADVLATLVDVIENPDLEELLNLLPFAPVNNKTTVTGVQVNRFSCDGMALSVSISHKIADAATAVAFISAWALKACGVSNNGSTPLVRFDSASFFPQMDLNGIYDHDGRFFSNEKIVTRRLIFHKEKIDQLKKQCDDGKHVKPLTRVEVVSTFIWKQFIKVAKAKPMASKTIAAAQIVNLRAIKLSPIPRNCYGNLFWRIYTHAPTNSTEANYTELVGMLRNMVRQLDTSYLEKIQTGECLAELKKDNEDFIRGKADFCVFSSITRFPLYEVNFGSGTPLWVSQTTIPFKNMVFMISSRSGEEIEAWVNALECDIAALEQDHEFLSLVSRNVRAKL